MPHYLSCAKIRERIRNISQAGGQCEREERERGRERERERERAREQEEEREIKISLRYGERGDTPESECDDRCVVQVWWGNERGGGYACM